MKITRKTLIRLTAETLQKEPALTPTQRTRLLRIANNTKAVLLNGWYNDEGLGCLVGTLLKRGPAVNSAYENFGCKFDRALSKHLKLDYEGEIPSEAVEIIG